MTNVNLLVAAAPLTTACNLDVHKMTNVNLLVAAAPLTTACNLDVHKRTNFNLLVAAAPLTTACNLDVIKDHILHSYTVFGVISAMPHTPLQHAQQVQS